MEAPDHVAPRVRGGYMYTNFFLTQLSSISERIVTIAKAAFDSRVLTAGATFAGTLSVVLLFPEKIPLYGAITLTLIGLALLALGIVLIVLKVSDQDEIQRQRVIRQNILPKINQVEAELNLMIKDTYDSNAEIEGYKSRCFELLNSLEQQITQEIGADFPYHGGLTNLVRRAQIYRDNSNTIRYTIEMGGRIFKDRLRHNIQEVQYLYTRF